MTTDAPTRPALTQADHDFAMFCETGRVALNMGLLVGLGAGAYEMFALAATMGVEPSAPRIASGYEPKLVRNAVAHGFYTLGARVPGHRPTAADKALAEAKRWGLAS